MQGERLIPGDSRVSAPRRDLLALGLLAIVVACAANAGAEDAPSTEPRETVEPDVRTEMAGTQEIVAVGDTSEASYALSRARWLSYGTTGFGLALTVGVAVIGGATRIPGLFLAGVIAADIVLAVGPSLGHYSLRNSTQAGTTLFGRLVLLSGGTLMALLTIVTGQDRDWFIAGAAILGAGALALAIFDFATLKSAALAVAPTAWIGSEGGGLAAVGTF